MGLCHLATVGMFCAHRAVIWTLWCWVSVLWPSQYSTTGGVKQSVFLLDSVPRLLRLHQFIGKSCCGGSSLVGVERLHGFGIERLAKTQQVVAQTERVPAKLDRFEHHLR